MSQEPTQRVSNAEQEDTVTVASSYGATQHSEQHDAEEEHIHLPGPSYWPILLADATLAAGGRKMYEATLFNVESFFGWTIDSDEMRTALSAPRG